MILILMQSRSGSSLVASIFHAHGYDTQNGGARSQFGYDIYEHVDAKDWLRRRKGKMNYKAGRFAEPLEGIEDRIEENDCVKIGIEYWPCFRHIKPLVFCVRRDLDQIAKSLSEKRSPRSRSLQPPREMVRLVRVRNRLLDRARDESGGIDIHVEPIVAGDFSGLRAAFEHHGLEFDEGKAAACVDKKKFHHR